MNILFNLTAVQPIHSAKFHGGGSYGEVLFWKIVERLHFQTSSETHLFCAYDSKKHLDPEILNACRENRIPLCDIREKKPQSIVDENKIDTFYTPLFSLEKNGKFQSAVSFSPGTESGLWKCNTIPWEFFLHGLFPKKGKPCCATANVGKNISTSPNTKLWRTALRMVPCRP